MVIGVTSHEHRLYAQLGAIYKLRTQKITIFDSYPHFPLYSQ